MQGIYKITNKQNGKVYIGQASNIEERISEHKQKRFIPIDMWINMLGAENFDFEVIEECTKENIDEKEQYYIQLYNSRENGYNKQLGGNNNSVGEGNGRAKLTYEDVINIRKAYASHQSSKQTYENYKDKVSFDQFQAVWQGRSWSTVMPEVFTEENKRYYTHNQFKEKASISKEELLKYRKLYVTHTANEVYQQFCEDRQDEEHIKQRTFQRILTGDVRANSVYLEVPLYKKSMKRWELNGEPVSTILESEE